eukprot:10216824-Ditylum_brightwellii.AAC.1
MKTAPISKQSNPDRPSPRQLECNQYHTYKLCTIPADVTLSIYKRSVPFFDEGTPKEWIEFQRGLQAVLKGQNVT